MTWIAGLLTVPALAWLVWRWNTRPILLPIEAEVSPDFPSAGFSHDRFEAALKRFVDSEGRVDYAAWRSDREAMSDLDAYLAAVARFSPDRTPERFTGDDAHLVYWVHAYNAFAIKAVLANWPIRKVTDVKAPLEVVRGLGFFYRLRFVAGGRAYSLYEIERRTLSRHRDPRVHFILNCATAACPAIRTELPAGPKLESTLRRAATEFVSDPRNVQVDHEARRVRLSALFKWYRRDFVTDLRRRGLPAERGVVDYVRLVADAPLRAELDRAAEYDVEFMEYDWAVNAGGAG